MFFFKAKIISLAKIIFPYSTVLWYLNLSLREDHSPKEGMTTKKSLEERSKYYKEVELEKLVSLMIMFSFDSEVFKFGVEEPQENVRS